MRQKIKLLVLKIKRLRESKGLSQRDLSNRITEIFGKENGVSSSYIGMIESGQINPSLKSLGKIATALGVEPSYLLHESGDGPTIEMEKYKDHYSLREKEFLAKEEVKPLITLVSNLAAKGLTVEQIKKSLQLVIKLTNELEEGSSGSSGPQKTNTEPE